MTARDTMVEAIALSSPSGRTSKRARRAAQERLRKELFGQGLPYPTCPQPTQYERLMREARELRLLAARGMHPRAYNKRADELEIEAQQALVKEG